MIIIYSIKILYRKINIYMQNIKNLINKLNIKILILIMKELIIKKVNKYKLTKDALMIKYRLIIFTGLEVMILEIM